jgi:hypothetical protein
MSLPPHIATITSHITARCKWPPESAARSADAGGNPSTSPMKIIEIRQTIIQ